MSDPLRTVQPMTSLRAAIYCRISDDRSGAGLGVARQRADCEQLVQREGWEVAAVHVDNDLSAFSGKRRPGYEQLLADLRAGSVDAVVAWHLDRLHRSTVELEGFIDVIESTGAQVRTVTAGHLDLSTPSGRMTARVAAAVARHESEHKAERIRRKMVELLDQGRSTGGARSFGFMEGNNAVRPDEAQLVREAAQRALAGESLTSIARDWNVRGVPTVRGADGWTYQALRRVLTSPRHAGWTSHRGKVVASAVWDATLDRDTFDRLQMRLAPGRAPVSRVRKRLLTGIAYCGNCGARLYSKVGSGRSSGTPVYRCVKVPGRGQLTSCGSLSVVAEPLDDIVGKQVLTALEGPGLSAAVAAASGDDEARRALANQLAADEARLEKFAADYALGEMVELEWRTARRTLLERIEGARRRMAEIPDVGVLVALPSSGLSTWWDSAHVTARRAVVGAVIERVTVAPKGSRGGKVFDPARVEVAWRL